MPLVIMENTTVIQSISSVSTQLLYTSSDKHKSLKNLPPIILKRNENKKNEFGCLYQEA